MIIKLKHSANSGNVPSNLANGEVSLNTQDQLLYYKHANGSIVILANGATLGTTTQVTQVKETEVDFGNTATSEMEFTIIDPEVTPNSHITGTVAYKSPTGKDLDEVTMDSFELKFGAGNGQFLLYMAALDGDVADKFKVNYLVG